ncbi:MAG: isoprenylcysteine carboxylmethyltransferase family protein [Firmicutes bacterium]|nr:isoprenylcysteine carboxylmethyltransferase family protein [Bacillota bacterium]
MKKGLDILTKVVIVIVYIYTWRVYKTNISVLNSDYVFLYLILFVGSLLSDRHFFKGQSSENKKGYEMTSYILYITWFITLIIPLLEYVYMVRYNILVTLMGTFLIVLGIIIRGIGIKTLGKFFSRDVETWSNQKVVRVGIYKYIRHPAYCGNILQVIGFPLVLNSYYSLVLSIVTICIFLWRIKVEEKFLIKELPEYKEYIKETKRVIPKIW